MTNLRNLRVTTGICISVGMLHITSTTIAVTFVYRKRGDEDL
jgi:hypothetical protein